MKKVVTILLLITITTAGVFADPANIGMTSIVPEGFLFGVGSSPMKKYPSMPTDFTGSIYGKKAIITEAFEKDEPIVFYMGYITNKYYTQATKPIVRVVANPFHHMNVPSLTVGYGIAMGSASANPIMIENDGTEIDLGFTELVGSGLRQEEVAMYYVVMREAVSSAMAGRYEATITFNIEGT